VDAGTQLPPHLIPLSQQVLCDIAGNPYPQEIQVCVGTVREGGVCRCCVVARTSALAGVLRCALHTRASEADGQQG